VASCAWSCRPRLLDRLESHDTLTPDDVDPASASHDLDRPAKAVDAALTEPSALARPDRSLQGRRR